MTKIPDEIYMKLTAAHVIVGDGLICFCDDACGQYNLCHGVNRADQHRIIR